MRRPTRSLSDYEAFSERANTEHPLSYLAGCVLLLLLAAGMLWLAWRAGPVAEAVFGAGTEYEDGSYRQARRNPARGLATIIQGIRIVSGLLAVAFIAGAVWYTPRAVVALIRGKRLDRPG